MTNRVSGSIGQQIGKVVLGWLNPPWKPGAAALTGAVTWYLFFPVLQAETIEFRSALINPKLEHDPMLRNLAVLVHRAVFIDMSVFCEVMFVGAISVIMLNFAIFVWRRLNATIAEFRATDRQRSARSRPVHTTEQMVRLASHSRPPEELRRIGGVPTTPNRR